MAALAPERFALHVKGQELPMHDPRGKKGLSLAYALSPTGADHMEAPHDPLYAGFHPQGHPMGVLGLIEPLDPLTLENYERVFNPVFLPVLFQSLFYAATTTVLSLLIGLPIAYWISRYGGRHKALLLILVSAPFVYLLAARRGSARALRIWISELPATMS